MKRYDSYKDSGVEWIGEIPSHWEIGNLNKVIDRNRRLTYGIVQAGEKLDVGIPYIRPVDMSSAGIPSICHLPKTSPEIASAYVRSEIKEGDIVMSIGPSYGKIGIAQEEHNGSNLTQGTARIAITGDSYNKYFFFLLASPRIKEYWASVATGATFPALNLKPLGNTSVVIPPLSEQQQIVSYLDTKTALIDSLIEKTQQKIELLKEKRTSLINEVVTKGLNPNVEMKDSGVEWIGQIPNHWDNVSTKLVSKIVNGSTPKNKTEYWKGDVVWVTPSDIGPIKEQVFISDSKRKLTIEGLNSCGCSMCPKNSLILTNRGPIGNVIISTVEFTTNQGCKVMIPKENMNVKYLYYFFKISNDELNMLGQGTTFLELSTNSLSMFKVNLPPLPEQQQIVKYLDEQTQLIDKTISIEERRIELLKEYRQSLISEVVTGKVKVVD